MFGIAACWPLGGSYIITSPSSQVFRLRLKQNQCLSEWLAFWLTQHILRLVCLHKWMSQFPIIKLFVHIFISKTVTYILYSYAYVYIYIYIKHSTGLVSLRTLTIMCCLPVSNVYCRLFLSFSATDVPSFLLASIYLLWFWPLLQLYCALNTSCLYSPQRCIIYFFPCYLHTF